MTIDIPEGYEALGLALGEAVAQASHGKGSERHAEKGEPFSDQLIMSIPKRLGEGGECFCLGQALKKICESRRLAPAPARAELLGAINYLAAAWSLLGGTESAAKEQASRLMSCGSVVSAPDLLFSPGADVEFRVGGEWLRGAYVRPLESGMHEVLRGSSLLAVKEPSLRKAEPKPVHAPEDMDAAPCFQKGELVEYRASLDGSWTTAVFECMDGGYAVLSLDGARFRVLSFDVRPVEKL